MQTKTTSVDAYIKGQPELVGQQLWVLRSIIRELTPESVEGISYGMPAYKLKGKPLAYFAAYAKHIGLYATPSCHEAFASELSVYKKGKGSVQFPLGKPLPIDLIRRMVAFRAATIQSDQVKQQKGKAPKDKSS